MKLAFPHTRAGTEGPQARVAVASIVDLPADARWQNIAACKSEAKAIFRDSRSVNKSTTFPFMKPIHIPSGEGKKLNVLGLAMNIRVHGRDTGGVLSVAESTDQPGGGPPPHIHHREDETFQVLEGEYEFTCGEKTFTLRKGATLFAPRGVPHTYRYVGQTPGRLMVTLTPAGFEQFFEEVGALSPQQQQIPHVIEIGKKYGLEILPPPSA